MKLSPPAPAPPAAAPPIVFHCAHCGTHTAFSRTALAASSTFGGDGYPWKRQCARCGATMQRPIFPREQTP
jgi:hypothetical protein